MTTILEGDVEVRGNFSTQTMTVPNASVGNAQMRAGLSEQVAASKLQHQHRLIHAQESAAVALTESVVLHVVVGSSGVIDEVKAGNVVAATGAFTVTLDILKNGVTILTGLITLDNTNTAYTVLTSGVISAAALVVGDVLEVAIVSVGGGGTAPTGVFVEVSVSEDGT